MPWAGGSGHGPAPLAAGGDCGGPGRHRDGHGATEPQPPPCVISPAVPPCTATRSLSKPPGSLHPSWGWVPVDERATASPPRGWRAGTTHCTTHSHDSSHQRLISEPACEEEMMRSDGGCRKTLAGLSGTGRGEQSEITLAPRTAGNARGTSRHRVTPAPERQAPVMNEALIWQARKERTGGSSPPRGSGGAMARVSFRLGCCEPRSSHRCTHKGGEASAPALGNEQGNYIYFTLVLHLKAVTAATRRESQPGTATNSCQSHVPTGEPGNGCDRGSSTISSATRAQTHPSRKNEGLKVHPPSATSAFPSKIALGPVGSTNNFIEI